MQLYAIYKIFEYTYYYEYDRWIDYGKESNNLASLLKVCTSTAEGGDLKEAHINVFVDHQMWGYVVLTTVDGRDLKEAQRL